MFFDTHAHYDDKAFDEDRLELLAGMPELRGLTCGGICAELVRERLLQDGVGAEKIAVQTDYDALCRGVCESEVPTFILPSYTGMMEFRPYLAKKTGGGEFWE